MSTVSTSINGLADVSLAHIFAFLPPDERVRLERVCRKWRQVASKHAWTEFRTLSLEKIELTERGDKAVAKWRALIHRCGPYLRELSLNELRACDIFVKHQSLWARLRNLRHLRFDRTRATAGTLRAIAKNLPPLQNLYFSYIDSRSVAALRDLLRVYDASLQALRLPASDSFGDSLGLPALPSSLRSLHINDDDDSAEGIYLPDGVVRDYVEKILWHAAECCPHLSILMLPMNITVSKKSLAMLAQFENLFYLRLNFKQSHVDLFGNTLAKIGPQLRALLIDEVDPAVLHLIAKHCHMLEHCFFDLTYFPLYEAEGCAALRSVFQLAHLRSVSICYNQKCDDPLDTQIFEAIGELNAKGKLEYLHLAWELSLPVDFITNLVQRNPKLRKLTCAMHDHTPAELEKLKTLLQNLDGSLELELFEQCPPELEMGENSRVRLREEIYLETVGQPILRQFWGQAMDLVPDLGDLDD